MKAKLSFKQSILAGLLAAGAASVVNVILFFILKAMGVFTDDIMVQPDTPLTFGPVIISSVFPTLIASIVFFLLEKYTKNGFKTFTIISAILLVLSFGNPFMAIPGVTLAVGLGLDFMHIVVVGCLLFFLNRSIKNNTK